VKRGGVRDHNPALKGAGGAKLLPGASWVGLHIIIKVTRLMSTGPDALDKWLHKQNPAYQMVRL